MLPASNRGIGGDVHFPDVCKTPMPPPVAMLPLPYPNIALSAMAASFSPNVYWSFVPALNMMTRISMSMGDEPGAMGGLVSGAIKGPAGVWAGSPIVFVNGAPAKHLLCPTHSNNYNAPLGMSAIPSVTNVLLCERVQPVDAAAAEVVSGASTLRATNREPIWGRSLGANCYYLRIERFVRDSSTRVFNLLRRTEGHTAAIIDLRGNPGGEARAALELCDDMLPRGTMLGMWLHGDGDQVPGHAKQDEPYRMKLVLLIDSNTASAAEMMAGTLQFHRRALIVGQRSYGKSSAHQRLSQVGEDPYPAVARWLLPNGQPCAPVQPDVRLNAVVEEHVGTELLAPNDDVLRMALEIARTERKHG